MKFEKDLQKIVVYIYDDKVLKENIENIIKKVLFVLNNYYKFNFYSSYELMIYINEYYGMIIEIQNDEFDLSDNIVNLKVKILKSSLFLYETEDPLDYLDNEIYYYDGCFFINCKSIDNKLIENSNIVYGKDVYKIIGMGVKIN